MSQSQHSPNNEEPPKILPLPVSPGFGRGWGTAITICPHCGLEWMVTAPMGIKEIPCPSCGKYYICPGFENSPLEMANDGCWITGRLYGDF